MTRDYQKIWNYSKEKLDKLAKNAGIKNYEEKYLKPNTKENLKSLENVMRQFAISLQNRQRVKNSIDFKNNEPQLKDILYKFNPQTIWKHYYKSDKGILREFKKKLKDKFKKSKTTWENYARYIYSAASFLKEFDDVDDFKKFAKNFSYNTYTKSCLPMLLAQEIEGFGFALACDCLKELGIIDCPKPDVHIIKILKGLKLIKKEDSYLAYKQMIEMANEIGCTAYELDKVFWLICTENFYREEDKSSQRQQKNKKRADKNRNAFIKELRQIK